MRGPRLFRPLSTAAAAALATVAVAALGVQPAVAASSDCLPNSFCAWQHSSYGGQYLVSPAGENVSNVGRQMNDSMTSYWNRTGDWISIYYDSGYRGCLFAIPPGGSDAAVDPEFNDRMTSFAVGKWC
ncbi:peptidase inhibitor family I36 protein [Streptomyces sp. NPDC050416]|uniref:peptidase inhibitor family I36 protein n=1 Tax=Streptomyces sp. NPDC050416 TaxID=3365611 RepID=UPI0037912C90